MSQPTQVELGNVVALFEGTPLGVARFDDRLRRTVALAAADPGQRIPDQTASVAVREALWRFLANPNVALTGVLSGHLRQTRARLLALAVVRIAHGTTTFRFLDDREGRAVLRTARGARASWPCRLGGVHGGDERTVGSGVPISTFTIPC